MIAECPKEDCDFRAYYLSERDAKKGIKQHINKQHIEGRIQLLKKAEKQIAQAGE